MGRGHPRQVVRRLPGSTPDNAAATGSARGIVARYFRAWNDGDPSHIDELIGPDWVDHAHPERLSIDDVRDAIAAGRLDPGAMGVRVDAILGDDTLITVNGRLEIDGRTRNRVWIVRVHDGLMREMWTYRAD